MGVKKKMLKHNCLPEPLFDYNQTQLYNYYIENIASKEIKFYGNQVRFFDTPVVDGYQQGFHHISTKENKKLKIRIFEQRAYYINWVIPVIENVSFCLECEHVTCPKICIWSGVKKGIKRKKLLVEEDEFAYLIILEMKKNIWYVITGFLIDKSNDHDSHYLNAILLEYNNSIQKKSSYTTA